MKTDYSKLLPALFNDKDLCLSDTMEYFFAEFDGVYCCNSQGTTFVGFIKDQEIHIHSVANRLEIKFTNGNPSQDMLKDIQQWLDVYGENDAYIVTVWLEDDHTIIAQYYWNPNT